MTIPEHMLPPYDALGHIHRPWGWYENLFRREGMVLKRICLSPGAEISLQFHRKRKEMWHIETGPVRLTIGSMLDEATKHYATSSHVLPTGGTAVIEPLVIHRMSNDNSHPVYVLELQVGECDEDDIVRLEDLYGRTT